MPLRQSRIAALLYTLALFAALTPPGHAADAPGELLVQPATEELAVPGFPEPTVVPEVLRLAPAETAASAALKALDSQPIAPGVPYRNGFSRSGPERRVEVPAGTFALRGPGSVEARATAGRGASWLGRFVVEGSYAVRVLLRDVELPAGARIWLHAGDRTLGPFGEELLDPEGRIWLPPAPGPEVVVEVELAAGSRDRLAFAVGEVMELVDEPSGPEIDPQVWTDCDVDAVCVDTATLSTIDRLREATARLSFVDGAVSYLCSGGLLNDTDPSGFRPFLLTANHCFSTQASASSLVAYFDYRTSSCGGSAPSLFDVPSVAGATLLATSTDSDFTFVELSANPSGSDWFLGWTTTEPGGGTALDRVSHPQGTPQKYSASSYTGAAGLTCSGLPVSNFHYSGGITGSTAGGSSGAPVTVDVAGDPRVVGQLTGACHLPAWDDCSYATYTDVDGAFAVTFPFISEWLDPQTTCDPDAFEPDDASGSASAIVSGSPQSHSLCPAGDEDWSTFTLVQEAAVTLETSGAGGDTRMWLYDSGLSEVEFDDDSGTGLFSFIDRQCGVDALPAGTYHVKIDEFGDDDEIAAYTLTYTHAQSCGGCPVNLTLANDTLSGTQSLRASSSITLGPSLVIDGTAIDVLAGDRVVISGGTEIGGSFSAGTHPSACSQ